MGQSSGWPFFCCEKKLLKFTKSPKNCTNEKYQYSCGDKYGYKSGSKNRFIYQDIFFACKIRIQKMFVDCVHGKSYTFMVKYVHKRKLNTEKMLGVEPIQMTT